MRPVIINPSVEARALEVVRYAKEHRHDLAEINKRIEAGGPAVGDDPHHVVSIPVGIKVVYSIEEQPQPYGWVQHVSISIDRLNRYPHPAVVNAILPLLGIKQTMEQCIISWIEDEWQAINFLFKPEEP